MTRSKQPKIYAFSYSEAAKSGLSHFVATLDVYCPVIFDDDIWDSLPKKPLPGRLNLVLSRDLKFEAEGGIVCSSLFEALDIAREHAIDDGAEEICVIGGANLFAQVLPRADRLYVTLVHATLDGDTHFPAVDAAAWRLVSEDEHERGEGDDHAFAFRIYERIKG